MDNKYEVEANPDAPFPQALMREYRATPGQHRVLRHFQRLVDANEAFEVFYFRSSTHEPVPVKRGTEEQCVQVMDEYYANGVYCIYEGRAASDLKIEKR